MSWDEIRLFLVFQFSSFPGTFPNHRFLRFRFLIPPYFFFLNFDLRILEILETWDKNCCSQFDSQIARHDKAAKAKASAKKERGECQLLDRTPYQTWNLNSAIAMQTFRWAGQSESRSRWFEMRVTHPVIHVQFTFTLTFTIEYYWVELCHCRSRQQKASPNRALARRFETRVCCVGIYGCDMQHSFFSSFDDWLLTT